MASEFSRLMAGANKHAVAGSSRLLATDYGKHIFSVKITENLDNGTIIGIGTMNNMEYYTQAAAGTFEGKVIGTASNGNYYVEVTKVDDNTVLVLTTPSLYEEYTTAMQNESQFYNATGDIARAYGLAVHDIFELSVEGFTATPTVNDEVVVDTTTHKLKKKGGQ